MAQVVDYSAGQPGAAKIKAAKYVGAVRYIGYPSRAKCTTAAELRDFTAQGIGMALVHENTATDWRGGFSAGRAAGAAARSHATSIGFPAGRPIYMAIDQDVVTEAEFRSMLAYLDGAAQTLGGRELVGVYGEHDVMARAQAAGVASWFWQTRAWSGTPAKLFAGRHLYQHVGTVRVGGIDCDINEVLKTDWGQHHLLEGDDDMKPTDEAIDPGPDRWGHTWLNTNQLLNNRTFGLAALGAQLKALTAAVAADKDVDEGTLQRMLDESVAAHMPTAADIAAESQAAMTAAVREALGEDNDELAADIVRRFGAKLGAA